MKQPAPICWRFANAASAAPELFIEDDIGGYGLTVTDFRTQLNKITARRLILNVHSAGGAILDGFAMYDTLKAHPAFVTGRITLAASAASVVALAADRVEITPLGAMMIHRTSIAQISGGAEDLEGVAAQLRTFDNMIAGVYMARAGGTLDEWLAAMTAETWYRGPQAVAAGLADAVVAERLAPAASLGRQMAVGITLQRAVDREVAVQMAPLIAARVARAEAVTRAYAAAITAALPAVLAVQRRRRKRRPIKNIYYGELRL